MKQTTNESDPQRSKDPRKGLDNLKCLRGDEVVLTRINAYIPKVMETISLLNHSRPSVIGC
jgi:hypothetical protein